MPHDILDMRLESRTPPSISYPIADFMNKIKINRKYLTFALYSVKL